MPNKNDLNIHIYNGTGYTERILELVTGITIGSENQLATSSAIETYISDNNAWISSGNTTTLSNTGDTVQLNKLQFNRIDEQPSDTGITYMNSAATYTLNTGGTIEEQVYDYLYYSNGRWYERLTGDEVFVQTLDASDAHDDLPTIGEYCARQHARMQRAKFFSPFQLEDGTLLYGTGNLNKVGFNIYNMQAGDNINYNLVKWEGIFSPYTTSGTFMSHPAYLRFYGNNIVHNKLNWDGFSFQITAGASVRMFGYGKEFFEIFELFCADINTDFRVEVGMFRVGSISNGSIYVGGQGSSNSRSSLYCSHFNNNPNLYLASEGSKIESNAIDGTVYVGYDDNTPTSTYTHCTLDTQSGEGASIEVHGSYSKVRVSGCDEIEIKSTSSGSTIYGSDCTIVVNGENNIILGSNNNITVNSGAIKTVILGTGNNITDNGTDTIDIDNLGGSSSLDGLTDVTITTPSSGDTLVYDSGIWVNSSTTTDLSSYYTKSETDNNFLSGNTTVSDIGGYTTTEVDNNFLSANTSYYTQTEADANFLSATTVFNSLDTQIIFNSGGTLTGSSNLTYDGTVIRMNGFDDTGVTLYTERGVVAGGFSSLDFSGTTQPVRQTDDHYKMWLNAPTNDTDPHCIGLYNGGTSSRYIHGYGGNYDNTMYHVFKLDSNSEGGADFKLYDGDESLIVDIDTQTTDSNKGYLEINTSIDKIAYQVDRTGTGNTPTFRLRGASSGSEHTHKAFMTSRSGDQTGLFVFYIDGSMHWGNIASPTEPSTTAGRDTVLWREGANLLATGTGDDFHVKGTTTSTSETTGALTVDGGVGIAENLNVNNNIKLGGEFNKEGDFIFRDVAETNSKTTVTIEGNGLGGASWILSDGSFAGYSTSMSIDNDIFSWDIAGGGATKISTLNISHNGGDVDINWLKPNDSESWLKYNATSDTTTIQESGGTVNIGGSLNLVSGTSIYDISTDSGFTSISDNQIATTQAIKDYFDSQSGFIQYDIHVAKNGDDLTGNGSMQKPYLTIEAALSGITDNSTTNRYTIIVGGGVYIENTLTLKPYVKIEGSGLRNTVIQPNSTGDTLFNAVNGSVLTNFTISSALSGVNFSEAGIFLFDKLLFADCKVGLNIENSSSTVTGTDLLFATSTSTPIEKGVNISAGLLNVQNPTVILSSYITYLFYINGINSKAVISTMLTESSNVETVVYADNDADVVCLSGKYFNMNKGFVIGYSGSTRIVARGVSLRDSQTYDLEVLSPTGRWRGFNTCIRRDQMNVVNINSIKNYGFDSFENNFRTIGDSVFGVDGEGSRLYAGEGGPYKFAVKILEYDGSTSGFTEKTVDDEIGTETSVDSAIYFGDADEYNFYSINLNIVTGITLADLDKLVWEYYDGGVNDWVQFNRLSTLKDYSNRYNPTLSAYTLAIRFDQNIKTGVKEFNSGATGWVSTTVSGITAKWIRSRVVSGLTSKSTFKDIRLIGNTFTIRKNGTQNYHGEARAKRQIQAVFGDAAGTTTNATINVSQNVSYRYRENSFVNGATDATNWRFTLPDGIDTSSGLKVKLEYCGSSSNSSGSVETAILHLGYSAIPYPQRLNASYTDDNVLDLDLEFEDGYLSRTQQRYEITNRIDISSLVPGDQVFFELERLSNETGDDYDANVLLLNVDLEYRVWENGKSDVNG